MGHNRLGLLPRTYRWKQVIKLLEESADLPDIVKASIYAVQNSLLQASKDQGLTIAITNIFKFIEAIKSKDYRDALYLGGYLDKNDDSIFSITAKFKEKVEKDLDRNWARSDVSEIAIDSFLSTLNQYASHETRDIFDINSSTLANSLRKYTSNENLKQLMHEFHSRFTINYLQYYLSREMSNHVGPGRKIGSLDEHKEFNQAFDLYIRQAVKITDDFTPGWYGKAQYTKNLNHESVSRYTHVAFKKIISEIR